MRVQGDNNPGTFLIHARPDKPGMACVRLYENVCEIAYEDGAYTKWEYDEHILTVPYADNLHDDVAANINEWLQTAKSIEDPSGAAAEVEDMRAALSLLGIQAEEVDDA